MCSVSHIWHEKFFRFSDPWQVRSFDNVQNEQFPRRYSNMAGTLRPYFGRLRTAANVR